MGWFSSFSGAVKSGFTHVQSAVTGVVHKVPSVVHSAVSGVTSVGSSISHGVSGGLSSAGSAISRGAQGIRQGLTELGVPSVIRGLGEDVVADLNIPNQLSLFSEVSIGLVLGAVGLGALLIFAK